jgi:hypothetical protein
LSIESSLPGAHWSSFHQLSTSSDGQHISRSGCPRRGTLTHYLVLWLVFHVDTSVGLSPSAVIKPVPNEAVSKACMPRFIRPDSLWPLRSLDWKGLVRCGMFEGCLAFHGSEVIALSCGIWAARLMGIRRGLQPGASVFLAMSTCPKFWISSSCSTLAFIAAHEA